MSSNSVLSITSLMERERRQVDEALAGYAEFGGGCPARLQEAIRYMLLAPGKRIRPLLTIFAARACEGNVEDAYAAGCAVEMIHTYSLIHDDLPSMDDDDFRRGQPSCHCRFDEATAILAGDALQARAFEVLARDVSHNAARCCAALAAAAGAEHLVGGQVDDLAGISATDPAGQLNELEQIHRRKTAALMAVSLELGGLVADASEQRIAHLVAYGEKLGLAFQIVDDLLDAGGDEVKMGKKTGSDQHNGTFNYPQLLGVDASRQRAADLIADAVAELTIFDSPADPLRELGNFVLSRDY